MRNVTATTMAIRALSVLLLCASQAPAEDAPPTTALRATISPARVPAGCPTKITYRWSAPKPLPTAYKVFVHVLDANDKMAFQNDHMPSVGTGTPGWQGEISYENRIIIPARLAEGEYRIFVGLYDKKGRLGLATGEGVVDTGGKKYEVGAFVVDNTAPRPVADTEKPVTLDLADFALTFSEEFDGPLDVSPWGPDTRWIAHTPWNGDFGDAAFANPEEGFPFTIKDGILRIEARKSDAFGKIDPYKRKWRAGLLASNDPHGKGFSQQYGYFEMRAKLPEGPGVWPAFWLCSSYDRKAPDAKQQSSVEIDVFEYYGHESSAYTSTVHVWQPAPHWGKGTTVITRKNEPSSGFHNYGCLVEPETITMYFDGVEVWKTDTPKEHDKPLMILLNLALGSGWPIDKTPNPSFMDVDYVRVYARKPGTPQP